MKARLIIPAILLLALAVSQAVASSHVRVILDTSGSMIHNDPPRLAILSTILLYDLAHPNLSLDDTFAVMPFERTTPLWRSGAPPSVQRAWIRAERDKRAEFANAIKSLEYNAPHTYYFPFLMAAFSDLKDKGTPNDRRVIVLVTDGVPEDADPGMIQRELVPELRRLNMRLYILALGPEAASHSREIQDVTGGTSVGELFIDPDGRRIPENMIEIFRRSFGYTGEPGTAGATPSTIDLESQQTPDRVAVVLYWRKPAKPEFRVRTVPDGDVNIPEGLHSAEVSGGSYSVSWILAPRRGLHKMFTSAEGASFVVLRPASLSIEIQPQRPEGQIYSAIAKTPFPLRVLVRPIGGNRGDPGTVELSFQVHGPRQGNGYAWDGDKLGAYGAGTGTSEGRYFDIAPQFPRDPQPPQAYYEGYISVEVRRGEAIIGSLSGDHAHRVLVYPYMQIQPGPQTDYAKINGLQRALGRHEIGCASFRFNLEGSLPHPADPVYSLRAVVDPALRSNPGLYGAQYTLDSEALSYGSTPGRRPGNWFTGRHLSRKGLLNDEHQLCILLGKPREVDTSRPIEMNVQFTMIENPYDTYSAVAPFTLKVLIGPPTWVEKYASWLALALALLVLLLQLWYYRFRPEVPESLRCLTGNPPSNPQPLGEGPAMRRLLGLRLDKSVLLDNGSYTLGWVRPINRELYLFRPASGVIVENPELAEGGVTVAVNQDYRVNTRRGSYQFRLQYT